MVRLRTGVATRHDASESDNTVVGSNRWSPILAVRVAFVLVLLAASLWTITRTLTVRQWPHRVNPAPDLTHPGPSRLTGAAVRVLEGDGIVVSPAVRRMLDVLLGNYGRRSDLRVLFGNADGSPNIGALLNWAQTIPDSSSTELVPHLGALEELRSRMGFLPANGKILPVLYWEMQNRAHPSQDVTKLLGRLADYWDERPDVRAQYTVDGRVDLLAYLLHVNRIGVDNPWFRRFLDDSIPIRQVIAELRRYRSKDA